MKIIYKYTYFRIKWSAKCRQRRLYNVIPIFTFKKSNTKNVLILHNFIRQKVWPSIYLNERKRGRDREKSKIQMNCILHTISENLRSLEFTHGNSLSLFSQNWQFIKFISLSTLSFVKNKRETSSTLTVVLLK